MKPDIINHMDVYFMKKTPTYMIYMELIVRTGNIYENMNTLGTSHLLEHLLFTKKFELELFKKGIIYNGETGEDFVKYYFYASKTPQNQKFILRKIIDIINGEGMQETIDFDEEKQVVREELTGELDEPTLPLDEMHDRYVYGKNNILSATVKQTIHNLDKLNMDTMQDIYKHVYNPANCTIFVSGNYYKNYITKQLIKKIKLDRYMPTPAPLPISPQHTGQSHIISIPSLQKQYAQITYTDSVEQKDLYTSTFVEMYLQTLLHIILREKGLIYSVNVDSDMGQYTSNFNISFDSSPESFNHILKIIADEIQALKDNDIKELYYKMTKSHIQTIIDKMKGQLNIIDDASFYTIRIINRLPYVSIKKYYQTLKNVRKNDIHEYANMYMNNLIISFNK